MLIVFYCQGMLPRVEQFQSPLHIRNPYSTMIHWFAAIAIFFCIKSFKKKLVITPGQGYPHFIQFVLVVTHIFEAVFNKSNEDQGRDRDAPDFFGNLQMYRQILGFSYLLQGNVIPDVADLLFDTYGAGIAFIELVTQHFGKSKQHVAGRGVAFIDVTIYRIDRIEKKMRVELGFQKIKFVFHFFFFDHLNVFLKTDAIDNKFGCHEADRPDKNINE